MKLAMLEYWFMFDPDQTWQHFFQFEQDLAKFFSEHGMEAQALDTVKGDSSGRHIVYIKRKDIIKMGDENRPVGRPQTVGGKLKEMSQKTFKATAKPFLNKHFIKKEKGFARVARKAGK